MDEQLVLALEKHFARWPQAVSGAVSEGDVQNAEARIGVRLIADYRDFILRYGGGIIRGTSVLGLRQCEFCADEPPFFPEQTLLFRSQLPPELSMMVVISVDGAGNPIGFLDGSSIIFVFDYNFGGRHDLAPSFNDFARLALADLLP